MTFLLSAILPTTDPVSSEYIVSRPHMGTSQCFLGKPWGEHLEETNQTTGQWTAFFFSPEFIYFYSVVLALQAANVIFFLLTVYYLVQHWRNSAGIIKTETKGNFIIVLKLFFIMGNYYLYLNSIHHLLTFPAPLFRYPLAGRVYLPPHHPQERTRGLGGLPAGLRLSQPFYSKWADWSTLIGPGPSRLCSDWLRSWCVYASSLMP